MSGTSYQPVFNQAQPYPQSPTEPRDTQYYTPETEHLRLDDDPHALPSAPQPRFMGAEASGFRDSFASSNPTLANDYPDNNFSTSALNPSTSVGEIECDAELPGESKSRLDDEPVCEPTFELVATDGA